MAIYQGRGDFAHWNRAKLLRSGGWTLAIGGLVALGATTVLNALVAQIVIVVLLSAYLASRPRSAALARDDRPAPFKRLWGYGLAIYASNIAYMTNQQLDQLWLSLWVAPAKLGQYATAVTVSGLLLFIPGVIGPIVFSRMAPEAHRSSRLAAHSAEALLLGAMVLVPAGIGLALLGPWVVRLLYGAAFDEAGALLRILAPAAVVLAIGNILSDILRGAGKPMLATYGIMAGALATVIGLAYALPRYGIWGAAWVSLVAYGLMAAGQGLLAWKYLNGGRSPQGPGTSVAQ